MDLVAALVFFLGLAVGSFLNVVICRLPGGGREFFSSSRSRCPECGTQIRFYDNIPLLSFLLLGGKCRACGVKISWQYPLVELAMGGIALLLYFLYQTSGYFFVYLIFSALLLCCSLIDIRHRIIPDSLLAAGCIAGLVSSYFTLFPGLTNAFIGLAGGIVLPLVVVSGYELLRNKTLIGGGDIKLLGMIGAFVGWQPLGLVLFYAAMSGCLVLLLLRFSAKFSQPLPFAPFLTFGTVVVAIMPELPFVPSLSYLI